MDPETKTKIKAVQEVLPHLSSSDIEALLPRFVSFFCDYYSLNRKTNPENIELDKNSGLVLWNNF